MTCPKSKIPRFLPVKTCPVTNNQRSPYPTPLKGLHLHALRKENLVYLPDRRQQLQYIHHSCYGCNGSNGSHLELLHILTYFDILLNIHSKIRAKSRDITMPSSIFKYSSKCNVLHTIILNIVVQDIYTYMYNALMYCKNM